jgi:predicted lipase
MSIFVIFRGSEDTFNWLTDLNMLQTAYHPCNNCFVHEGFYAAQQSVMPSITHEVRRLSTLYPSYKLIIAGHSLGAALATLCAVELVLNRFPAQLYSYGSPRLVNSAGSEFISDVLQFKYRVTHLNDVIPHTPSTEIGYLHIEGEW